MQPYSRAPICYAFSATGVVQRLTLRANGRVRRRDFIKVVAGSAATWPLASRAQQPATPVIGLLHPTSLEFTREHLASFRQGLPATGYIEDRNVATGYLWAQRRNE